MKLLRLEVENIKRIKRVVLEPAGNFVVIGGENEQGKTSLLDSVLYLFCGKGKIPPHVLRDGAKEGHVEAIIGDCKVAKVTRKFKEGDKTQLIVTGADGTRFKSPQDLLNDLMGGASLTYDPTAFQDLPKDKQVDLVRSLDPELDFTKINKDYQEEYEQRRLVNQDIKRLEGKLNSMDPIPADLPEEEISLSSLHKQLQEAQAKNLALEAASAELERLYGAYAECQEEINHLKQRLEEKTRLAESIKEKGKALKEEINSTPPVDVSAFEEACNAAEETNRLVRAAADAREVRAELAELNEISQGLTDHLKEMDDHKKRLLSEASFPVPGLSFDESGVLVNGLPFDREHMSAAEMFRVSVDMAIALNQQGILVARQGALLDKKNRQYLREKAEEHNMLVLFEVVGEDDDCQVVIEDGAVKGD